MKRDQESDSTKEMYGDLALGGDGRLAQLVAEARRVKEGYRREPAWEDVAKTVNAAIAREARRRGKVTRVPTVSHEFVRRLYLRDHPETNGEAA